MKSYTCKLIRWIFFSTPVIIVGAIENSAGTRHTVADSSKCVSGSVQNLGPNINTPFSVTMAPFIYPDGERLYFMSTRPGGFGGADCEFFHCFDLYMATLECEEPTGIEDNDDAR